LHGSVLRALKEFFRQTVAQQATNASEEPQLVTVFDDFDLASFAFRHPHHFLFDVEAP
jgi:hypothetical protein